MSAWIVSKAHIDALVQQAIIEGPITFDDADLVGQTLWQECHNSVNARYRESTECPEYHFEGIEALLDKPAVRQLIGCYEYQSCEHDEWETSWARAFVKELDLRLRDVEPKGPWGIDSLDEIIAGQVKEPSW